MQGTYYETKEPMQMRTRGSLHTSISIFVVLINVFHEFARIEPRLLDGFLMISDGIVTRGENSP